MATARRTLHQREESLKLRVVEIEERLAQRKAQLQQLAARRQAAEKTLQRRERDRRLYTVGGLAELAQIANLDRDVLLGAFVELAENICDTATVELWKTLGADLHAQRAAVNVKSAAAQGREQGTAE